MIIELCAGSLHDARLAEKYGIGRIELNSALELGGLSPQTAVIEKIKSECNLKIIAMLRLRAGSFVYDSIEQDIMLDIANNLLRAGADGLAYGALTPDKKIDIEACKRVIDIVKSHGGELVFHRAFDTLDDISHIEELIKLGVDRLLTSGLYPSAWEGRDNIKAMQEQYGDHIEILVGSGVKPENILQIAEYTGVNQVHGSFSESISDTLKSRVDFGSYIRSSEEKLIELQKVINKKG